MATFLQLVNDVSRESGTISQQQELTTVVGATGRQRRVVNWTRQAWEMIQRARDDWTFQRMQGAGALTIGTASYTGSALSLPTFGRWCRPGEPVPQFTLYDAALGRGDELPLRRMRFEDWLMRFDVGTHDSQRPSHYAIGMDGKVYFGPTPDKAYAVRCWYRRGVQSLALDADEPFIDPDFHQAIVWRALMLLGDDDEAPFEVASSTAEYREIFGRMVNQYTDAAHASTEWP
jgi:hypothetical protein